MVSVFKEKWKDPEWAEKRREESRLQHKDPEFVRKLREGQQRPETQAKKSASLKKAFQDPEVKERHRKSLYKDRVCSSCGVGFIGPAAARRCEDCRSSNTVANKWKCVARLVARDGVACSICGEEVDLEAPGNTPRGASIDHVIASGNGGDSDMSNLALAHFDCNRKKGCS